MSASVISLVDYASTLQDMVFKEHPSFSHAAQTRICEAMERCGNAIEDRDFPAFVTECQVIMILRNDEVARLAKNSCRGAF